VGITREDYCSKVCGGKCCKHWEDNHTCRNLTKNCKCGIYGERFRDNAPDFEIVDLYAAPTKQGQRIKQLVCGRIEVQLEKGMIPKWIEKQCCYAHPELLEIENNGK